MGLPAFPDQASSLASQVDDLFLFELGVAAFFTALICLLIVSFAVAIARRSRADRSQPAGLQPLDGGDLDRRAARCWA